MSDPTYEVYSGTMRFDDDNIVDVNLQPDTENINVRLNGTEVTIGAELPAVTAADNGDVLTVVEGAWAKAEPTAELPAVTATDNGDVLTVVEGSWAKAEPASQLPAVTASDNGDVLTVVSGEWAKAAAPAGGVFVVHGEIDGDTGVLSVTESFADVKAAYEAGKNLLLCVTGVGERAMFAHLYEYDDASDVISFQLIMISTNQSNFLINEVIFFYDDGWDYAFKNGKATVNAQP